MACRKKVQYRIFFFIFFSLHLFTFSCQTPDPCSWTGPYSSAENIYIKLHFGNTDRVNDENVNSQNYLGITPIMFATFKNNINVATLLLNKFGADPNIKSHSQDTPLLALLKCRHTRHRLDFMELLLENGADPNIQDVLGNTPLMIAGSKGRLRMAQLLLIHGAKRTLKNKASKTFLDVAGNRPKMVDLLKLEKIS